MSLSQIPNCPPKSTSDSLTSLACWPLHSKTGSTRGQSESNVKPSRHWLQSRSQLESGGLRSCPQGRTPPHALMSFWITNSPPSCFRPRRPIVIIEPQLSKRFGAQVPGAQRLSRSSTRTTSRPVNAASDGSVQGFRFLPSLHTGPAVHPNWHSPFSEHIC